MEKIEGGVKCICPDGVTISLIDGDITLYQMDFFEGGQIEVAYSQEGQVKGFTGRNVNQTLNQNNELMVSRLHSPAP